MGGDTSTDILRETPDRASLSYATICRLQTCAQSVDLDAGDRLSLDAIGLIVSGSAKLVRTLSNGTDHITAFAYAGAPFFGQTGKSEALQLTALEPARLLLLSGEPLATMWAEDGAFRREMMVAAMARIRSLEMHVLMLARMSACERVAAFLVSSAKTGACGDNPLHLHLPMSRADIGDHLGLTIETVSRCITRLKTVMLVACPSRHEMLILDLPRLANFHERP